MASSDTNATPSDVHVPTTPLAQQTIAEKSINTIRMLAVDAVQKANSGHPGMPMGAAPMAYAIWQKHLRHDPADPAWYDRDRFVLSAGHGSMLLYALLHLTGYDLPMEEIKQFRQIGSKTPGHPEVGHTVGVETTTGPLGQGFATGVGMAIAEAHLAARFNRPGHTVVDHYTYAIVSDGDLQEGVASEAASLAGHLQLGKMIYLYDDNEISIDGDTDISFTEDVPARFRAYGWHTLTVKDGTDVEGISAAIEEAKAVTDKPSLISVQTVIGYGSPSKQGTAASHGSPLGPEEIERTKDNLGWPHEPTFLVPDGVYDHLGAKDSGGEHHDDWTQRFAAYRDAHPDLADEFERTMRTELPDDLGETLDIFEDGSSMATRASSGKVLGALGPVLPFLVGGSADLTGSNKTDIKGREDFQPGNYAGQYFRFGVREHGMAAAMNGMTLHGGLIPYGGTFLVFSDYLRPSLRLAALMEQRAIYVLTHDSIGLGEDGPTHQPVEHYAALRAIPNMLFLRPADARETAQAWEVALRSTTAPSVLALTRQNLPTLDVPAGSVAKGGYILQDCDGTPDVILMGTGSEVEIAMDAAKALRAEGKAVRVVSLPCTQLFVQQDEAYRESVLPKAVTARVAVEAGVSLGWHRFIGDHGRFVGIDRFGASGPFELVYQTLGVTAEAVADAAREVMS